jgi:coatomer subunit beta
VVATALTKLALRTRQHVPAATANQVAAHVMLLLTGVLQLGKAGGVGQTMDADSQERITMYLHVLSKGEQGEVQHLCLRQCREAFSAMLSERQAAEAAEQPKEDELVEVARQADDLLVVRQLRGRGADFSAIELEEDDDVGLSKATGAGVKEDFASRLKRVTQLTGLSDPVYAEAYVTVHSYDILLEVLLINQTSEVMNNLCLELAVVGDLKLCERPQPHVLMPGESKHIRANIKVSSTETGIVFGSIVYDANDGDKPKEQNADRHCVVLNDIHIDIMDYIAPASCSDLTFRAMWAEFEWENKVAVNTDITDVREFLEHVVKSTNMKCLTPPSALEGDSGFLAANLYAKSIFGEDALVNCSVEKRPDGKMCGYIRIRSKTQGIALSLGDKITLKQKKA